MEQNTLPEDQSAKYFRVRLHSVPYQFDQNVSGLCFEAGATGLSEVLQYSQPDLTYDPHIKHLKFHDLDAYFVEKPPESLFKKLQTVVPTLRCQVFEETHKDWMSEWKKGFEPFCLAGNYWVVPSWTKSPVEPEYTLLIDPGMAFGTGTHATTQMASYFVLKALSSAVNSEGKSLSQVSLLDVGTGTGILAMLAAKMGVQDITGLEIDPEARRVARENIQKNSLNQIAILEEPLEEIHAQFDFVVANIIDGVLLKMRDDLIMRLNPNGHLFLTGILVEREEKFYNEFILESGLRVERRIEKDEWVGYWLRP